MKLCVSALLYSFITFHDRVERSMLMHNEEKSEWTSVCLCRALGPKNLEVRW
jgi:hypothetical protein